MSNGFLKHGIHHSSASSLNMWSNAPDAWVAKYLFDHKFTFSPPAKAGVFAEDAVVNVLARGWEAEKAVQDAVDRFNDETALFVEDSVKKRGEAIPGMIENALEALAEYGEPEFDTDETGNIKQKRINIPEEGKDWLLPIPIMGFIDFHFPKHGVIIDLKTTMRMPSVMSDEHNRQGAIYKHSMGDTNQGVKFLYVTGKKHKFIDVEDHEKTWSEIKKIIIRQERLLSALDKDLIREIIPVNKSSYYWSDDADIRKEMYGY